MTLEMQLELLLMLQMKTKNNCQKLRLTQVRDKMLVFFSFRYLTILVGILKINLSSLNMCTESCALQLAVATQ